MDWKPITENAHLDAIDAASASRPQLIFKHSTRCGVSSAALRGLNAELSRLGSEFDLHMLDLLAYRPLSNEIASRYGVRHESPQAIVVRAGEAQAHMSHWRISADALLEMV